MGGFKLVHHIGPTTLHSHLQISIVLLVVGMMAQWLITLMPHHSCAGAVRGAPPMFGLLVGICGGAFPLLPFRTKAPNSIMLQVPHAIQFPKINVIKNPTDCALSMLRNPY